jgi:hypothetical protein
MASAAGTEGKGRGRRAPLADGSLERFEVERVHRSVIQGAPYNPRTINDVARRKLRKNLERVGLLQPLVWNRRTGNMVSGHQRLAQMDDLMGTSDYHLRVAVVELDEQTEKEQNVFFNNHQAMGDWDFEKLGDLFKAGLEVVNTGFDVGDVKDLFGGDVLDAADLADLSNAVDKANEVAATSKASEDTGQDIDFYTVLVFRDNAAASRMNQWLGLGDERYIDARQFVSVLVERFQAGEEVPAWVLG